MPPKLILEKLPLGPDDVLLITISEKMPDVELQSMAKMIEGLRERLPHKNLIILSEFGCTMQDLRPLIGKFKVVNERLTVCTEENL